jgi:hypothetical protein
MTQTIEIAAARLSETPHVHTRLLKCTLCVDEARAYWRHCETAVERVTPEAAFEEAWFGAKSFAWVEVIVHNMRARFDAFPEALWVLARWSQMAPETRRLICHFHLQLTDPLYRQFTGEYLVGRHMGLNSEVRRHSVVRWVADRGPGRWTIATQTQFASRLLSCALAAGLVKGRRDPRKVVFPRVTDEALLYLLYMLRRVGFEGSVHANPYVASLGLEGGLLEDRLRNVAGVHYRRSGGVHGFEWDYPDLKAWALGTVLAGNN